MPTAPLLSRICMNNVYALIGLCLFNLLSAKAQSERQNFIVLLVDDWGWTDGGVFGSDLYETPNMDALAEEGVRFTNAYAACTVCSPTRAAMMTGQYPGRTNVTDFIPGKTVNNTPVLIPDWTQRLEYEHTTIAEALRDHGYKTAHIGKWHLTPRSEHLEVTRPYYPEEHGFDINVAGNQWGVPPGGYFLPNRLDLPGADEGEYLTHELTDRALAIIENWRDDSFFIYFPYYNVHTPIQAPADRTAYFQKQIKSGMTHTDAKYAAMVEAVDQSIGRLRAKLKDLKLDEHTTIILTGDNGGLDRDGRPTDNTPLREGKGSSYEGGVRVPGIVLAPGVSKPGISDEPIITVDVFPTLLDLANIKPSTELDKVLDGKSLVPLLSDTHAELDRDAVFFHYPHYHSEGAVPHSAIRTRDWKLIHFLNDDHIELYHLKEDISEKNDLSNSHPQKAADLLAQLDAWRKEVNAQLPPTNLDFDPSKPVDVSGRGSPTPVRQIDRDRIKAKQINSESDFEVVDSIDMLVGNELDPWKASSFAYEGDLYMWDGVLNTGWGSYISGVTWNKEPPARTNFEIELEARFTDGNDFFLGLTVPVKESYITWIVGGWGGTVVGISDINGSSADDNETTVEMTFEKERWYRCKLRVVDEHIQCWIDDKKIIDVDTQGKKVNLRPGPIIGSAPIGLAAYDTIAEYRNMIWRNLAPNGNQPSRFPKTMD